jgi:hypothetical protein
MKWVNNYEQGHTVEMFDRAAMVRLVVAQQWSVACALSYQAGVMVRVVPDEEAERVARMPCAVDVVNELMGEA